MEFERSEETNLLKHVNRWCAECIGEAGELILSRQRAYGENATPRHSGRLELFGSSRGGHQMWDSEDLGGLRETISLSQNSGLVFFRAENVRFLANKKWPPTFGTPLAVFVSFLHGHNNK